MKVEIKYYEQSWDEDREFAFECIEEVESMEQAEIAARYECQNQDFDHYRIEEII